MFAHFNALCWTVHVKKNGAGLVVGVVIGVVGLSLKTINHKTGQVAAFKMVTRVAHKWCEEGRVLDLKEGEKKTGENFMTPLTGEPLKILIKSVHQPGRWGRGRSTCFPVDVHFRRRLRCRRPDPATHKVEPKCRRPEVCPKTLSTLSLYKISQN